MTRRLRMILAVATVFLVATGLWFWRSSSRGVSTELLEGILSRVIRGATDGLYDIELGELTVAEGGSEFTVTGVRVAPIDAEVATARATGRLPALRFALEVESITLRGVEMAPLLAGHGVVARQIDIVAPTILATAERESGGRRELGELGETGETGEIGEQDESTEASTPAERDEQLARRVEETLAGIPELRVESVVIRDASGELEWWSAPGAVVPARRDRIGSVAITFSGLHIHEGAGLEGFRSLYSDDVSLRATEFELGGPETGAEWRLGGLAISTGSGVLQLDDVVLDPRVGVPEYLARPRVAEDDRTALWVGRVRALGFDYHRFLEGLELHMDALEVAAFRLEILNDRQKPSRRGTDDSPEPMPHDLVRELEVPLEVGEVRFTEGLITYSERPPEVAAPGVITFENIEGSISAISNDPRRMTRESPAVVDLRARMYGVAPVSLRFEVPLLEPAPTMRLHGEIGAFDPTVLNNVLTRLTGSEIRGGEILGMVFDVDYAPGRATGTFGAEYKGLGVSPVDKDTGDRSLLDRVVGFVASNFIIRSSNVSKPGDPARTASINYRIDPLDGFFKILWEPIRDGATELVID